MTQKWCEDRDHPLITYNPWSDRSYCRCGQRQEAGEQPMDWAAKREVFHHCTPDGPCGCYATGKADQPPPPGASLPQTEPIAATSEQASLFDAA